MAQGAKHPPTGDPDCRRCRHMIVTHDAAAPWGCRAFNFKGREFPARFVRQSSGEACQVFEFAERKATTQGKKALPHRDDEGFLA